jgi:DNA-binding MarR family transcriptional regulator
MTGKPGLPESTADGEPEPDLGELLRRASHAMRHRFAELLKPWDLSPHQLRALRVISSNEPLRLRELADYLRVNPRSVTEVVDALTERNLAERASDPEDRRATTVSTTAEARRLLAEVERASRVDAGDFFGRLTASERNQLAKLLGRLTADVPDHHRRRR